MQQSRQASWSSPIGDAYAHDRSGAIRGHEEQLKDLQIEVEQLSSDLERYRRATDDCLQQLGWCMGYFAGTNKSRLARAMDANVAHIRGRLPHRQPLNLPPSTDGSADAI